MMATSIVKQFHRDPHGAAPHIHTSINPEGGYFDLSNFIECPESDGTLEWKSCIEEILAVQD